MFSAFLEENRAKLRAIVDALTGDFRYVSLLATDVKSRRFLANRMSASAADGQDCERGFVLKMSAGGAFFEYSFDELPDDPKAFAAQVAAEFARADLPAAEVETLPVPDEPLKRDFLRESDFAEFSDEKILAFCGEMKDRILAADEKVANAVALLMTLDVSKMFLSQNRELTQNYTWCNGILLAYYRDGEKMVSCREGAYSHKLSEVIAALPGKIDRLIEKARCLVKATPIESGFYDVITDPSITGLIAHEAFGHGVEMDQFVKDRAIAKEYVGKYVASPIVSMRDGAGSTLSVASYFFDDDGVLAHDTQIIKDGILVSGICDLVSSRQLGCEPTGNGRRQSFKNKAYTRMTNTFFEKGSDKLSDMIASVKHGYMLFETNNGMEDPKNWAIQCVCEYGIEIVDGKLTDHYVSPVVMSGYVPDLLKSISMVSDDFEVAGAGQCGKGYKEWVRVSDGGPALKAKVKLS